MKWVGNILKNNNILNMGIIGIFILIVLLSGCTSSSTTKTFSDGVMSFNYPGNFINVTYSGEIKSGSPMHVIGKLESNNGIIVIGKNISVTSPTEIRDRGISKVKSMSNEVLSISTEINSNGVIVERSTYTQKNSNSGILLRYNDMFFKINDDVYAISVYGPDSDQQIINTTNIIFQSIK